MIQTVIKVGGSLASQNALKTLCRHLQQAGSGHRILIVPGGGPFADAVRVLDRQHRLSDSAAHWMAILAMDQYGYLICDLIPNSRPVRSLKAAGQAAQSGSVPVMLPFALFHREDPLPHSWSVTADAMAAWLAAALGASLLVLLKDTDGLYDRVPDGEKQARLLETIGTAQLAENRGVDSYLAKILVEHPVALWIINGKRPERLTELMATGQTTGTCYRPQGNRSRG